MVVLLQLDSVELSSWQAQLRGKKTWTLAPPPECESTCSPFNVTVNTGDMSKAQIATQRESLPTKLCIYIALQQCMLMYTFTVCSQCGGTCMFSTALYASLVC